MEYTPIRDTISVTIGADHTFGCAVVALGRTGEHVISRLEITIPDELCDFWAYLDFKKPSGHTVKTPRLDIVGNTIGYDIPQGLLDESGNLETQLVLQHENGEIWKSTVKKFVTLKSIDAEEDIPQTEDFITEAQKTLDETQELLDEINSRIEDELVVDPVFENNSWETIAKVARRGEAQNYWKVGAYKMLSIGETVSVTDLATNPDGLRGVYSELNNTFAYFVNVDKFLEVIGHKTGTYSLICQDDYNGTSYLLSDENLRSIWLGTDCYRSLGIKFNESPMPPDDWTFVVEVTKKEYPMQIIGFNHDKVSDPYTYGKATAGITLMLGCSRTARADVSVYNENIPKLSISASDNHIISPNKIDKQGNLISEGTNWSNGGFRDFLALHLDEVLPVELRQHIVPVDKLSSCYFNAKNYYRDWAITSDKYFLLSEFEMYGEQLNTKANEGDQYELFKLGDSKVIITPELWEAINYGTDKTVYGRLWFRSVASKYTDPYIPSTDYFNPLANYKENADYTNGVNTRTNSILTSYSDKFNYSPSTAHGMTQPTYIAPCMCL